MPNAAAMPWFSRLRREYEAGNLLAKQYLVLPPAPDAASEPFRGRYRRPGGSG